jgi:hypothetical protein
MGLKTRHQKEQYRKAHKFFGPNPKLPEPLDHDEYSQGEILAIRNLQSIAMPGMQQQLKRKKVDDIRAIQFGLFQDTETGLLMSKSRNSYAFKERPHKELDTHMQLLDDYVRLTQRDLIFLPGDRCTTAVKSLVEAEHLSCGHASSTFLVAHIRKKFWITGLRRLIRSVIHNCPRCKRLSAQPLQQDEAPLPMERLLAAGAFENVGIDYLGPLQMIKHGRRSAPKQYICVFTCAVTRAVHLELVEDLGFEQLELAYQRFIGTRNVIPKVVYSDAAPTFKAAAASVITHEVGTQFADKMSETTQWRINASRAPWWGGFYERFMKMIKDTLVKTFYTQQFPSEVHLRTALVVVMKFLNARPLTIAGCEDSMEPITPQQFLTPRAPSWDINHADWALKQVRTGKMTVAYLMQRRLNQGQYYQALWHTFVQSYTAELRKWHADAKMFKGTRPGQHQNLSADQLQPGAVVLLSGEQNTFKGNNKLARLQWRLALVTKIHRSNIDNLVRCIDLETISQKGIRIPLHRWPVQRVTLLELPASKEQAS